MLIELLASTQMHFSACPMEYEPHDEGAASEPDELAEVAGRNCYQSWSRPRPETATNFGYLKNILAMGHESVLEHASATFLVRDVSRALLAELTRHRHLSFSVLSQRYVDARDLDCTLPPRLGELTPEMAFSAKRVFEDHFQESLNRYEELLTELQEEGVKGKQAKEIARHVLPNSTDSPLVVTGNMRAWRDVLKKRWHVAADQELQEFAGGVLHELRRVAYNSFQDIPEHPFGSEK